jgi:hypothetical protein
MSSQIYTKKGVTAEEFPIHPSVKGKDFPRTGPEGPEGEVEL